jgi:hypothetical protein
MRWLLAVLMSFSSPLVFSCDYPNEGTMPLHRAVKRVELVPEVDDWTRVTRDSGAVVSFVILLNRPVLTAGKCHWTVEVSTGGKLWERFFVSPDGKSVRAELSAGQPASLQEWRRARRGAGARQPARPSAGATARAL